MKLGVFALLSICIYGHRGCGNEQVPSPEENAKIMEEISKYPPSQGLTETVVPVYFHIIVSENGLGNLSDETIAQQINVINKAFGPAGFRFETAGINRVVNDEWEVLTGAAWKSAAKALRKGGADTLNIYASNLPNSILGIAQFPFQARLMRSTDGVRCRTGTFPGAGYMDYDLGHTCVHEIGHWMGLYHTFQGGCLFGDGVSDTPPIPKPSFGCPNQGYVPACRRSRSPADVSNFMDYTKDSCMDHFTPGQNARMNRMWNRYRARSRASLKTSVNFLNATAAVTPTPKSELGLISFSNTSKAPTVSGKLVKGVKASISYDMKRMGLKCPTLRYCHHFGLIGWFSSRVCGTIPVKEASSIPVTFSKRGTAYLSFETIKGDLVCGADWPGFRGYPVTVQAQ